MKKLLSLQLGFLVLLSSLAPLAHAMESSEVIVRLEALSTIFTKECLPQVLSLEGIPSYIEKNGLTEDCWLLLTEINHLEDELEDNKTQLELIQSCDNGHCSSPTVADENLNLQLSSLSSIEKEMSCTEEKKQKISSQCKSDMKCVFLSASLGIGGYLADQLVPSSFKPESCHMGEDSCATRLATGFIRASITFLATAWDLLKLAGNKSGEKMSEFWDWVKGAEDHTSTAQLALAEASADEGIFNLIMNDFPAAMEKIWSGLIAAIKEWLKTNIFCQSWSGVPHLSQCLKPATDFDCMSCKSMTLGLCSISGALIAEVVPSFLTGGILAAVKHGANGASKIAKSFVVSNESINSIKKSQLGNKILTKPKAPAPALMSIKKYLLSPTRKFTKASFAAVNSLSKKGRLYLATTPTGKTLMFPGTVLKKGINVILYPIDNPLTVMGFNAGMRSYEKIFKIGPPELAQKTVITATLMANNRDFQSILPKMEEARVSKPQKTLKLEETLHKKVLPIRKGVLIKTLKENEVSLNDIIQQLYPELKYGDLAKKMAPQKITASEKELYLEIISLPASKYKDDLLKDFHEHVEQITRSQIVKSPFKNDPNVENYAYLTKLDETEINTGIQEHIKLLAVKSFPHQKLVPSANHELKINRTKIKSPREILRPLADNKIAELNTRIILKNHMGSYQAPADTLINLKIVQSPDTGDYMISLKGLDKRSSQKIIKDLASQKDFLHNLNGHFALQRTELDIEMRSSAKGTFDFQNIKISGNLSELEPAKLPTIDVTETIRRGAAPVFRGGNAVNKENSQD